MNDRLATSAPPPQPFFTTPEQRLALARERYFEEGIRPSGLVSEGVIQSWSRCLQHRRNPGETIAFDPVTESRIRSALARSRTCWKRRKTNCASSRRPSPAPPARCC